MPPSVNPLLRHKAVSAFVFSLTLIVIGLTLPDTPMNLLEHASAATKDKASGSPLSAAQDVPSPGGISFTSPTFSVNEGAGAANITLSRTGGSDGQVTAKINLTDVSTSPADYLAAGSLDTSFNTSPIGTGIGLYYSNSLTLQPDGKALISNSSGIRRLNTDGSVDSSFHSNFSLNAGVAGSAVAPDGKVIIIGEFTTVNLIRRNHIARLNADGTFDPTFDIGVGTDPSGYFNVVAVQPDGKVLVGGLFNNINGTARSDIARLNTDGSLDTTFNPGGDVSTMYALVLQPDGKVILGGLGYQSIMRLNSNGSVDSTFNVLPGSAPVLAAALAPDGKIIMAGHFNTFNGAATYNVARLNADGSLDTTFNTGSGPDDTVSAVAVQPDGKVTLAGFFTSINGTARQGAARLNANGSLDTSFNPGAGPSDSIYAMAMQPDSKVLIAGYFRTFDGAARPGIARLNGDLFATWAAGDAADKTITLPIVDDLIKEPNETLTLTLTPLAGGATTGANPATTLTIVDNDVPPVITSATPPSLVNYSAFYTHTFTASGYPAPTFAVTAGTLPPGLTLSATGVLSGVCYTTGFYSNITVTASNGVSPSASQTFSIRVNALPLANGDNYSTIENTVLTVSAPGVLGNDSDAEGDSLSATLVGNPAHGTLSFNANGSFTYTASLNYSGPDNFTYLVNDGHADSNIAAVFINVRSGGLLTFNPSGLMTFSEGSGNATVTVIRLGGSAGPATVDYATSDGTARAGVDYTAASGTLSFADGEFSKTFTVSITNNNVYQSDRTINVTLGNPTGSASLGNPIAAQIIIKDDDAPVLQFDRNSYTANEGSGSALMTVLRAGDASVPVTVDYSSSDGTARQRTDYTIASGTLSFAPGEVSKAFAVHLIDNAFVDGNRTVNLSLSNPVGSGALLGTRKTAILTVADNDTTTATTNPIDEAQMFVREQYLDFLNRSPDAGGLGYWSNEISKCGTDETCIHDQRVAVADAFFFEAEFQQTGGFVYRVYKAGLGRRPTYAQFMSDRGYVVTGTGLDQSKTTLTQSFVQRTAFLQLYPRALSADQFVDALLGTIRQNSGVDLGFQRSALIALYDGTDAGRAAILKQLADAQSLIDAEYNSSFVLMEYFGYLRRDADQGGYDFWLAQVNKFPLRDVGIQHAMACSFITSSEYQTRFSSVVTHSNRECPQ